MTSTTTTPRPFKVLGIQKIAIGGVDKSRLRRLWIDDLPAAVGWLTARGVRFAPGGIRKGAAGFDICFLHPKANDEFPIAGEGVLVELVQAPGEVVRAFAALAAGAPSASAAG